MIMGKKMPTFGQSSVQNEQEKVNNKQNENNDFKSTIDEDKIETKESGENNKINEEVAEIDNEIEELKQINSELEKKLMYVVAELQNTKRIAQQEKENATKFAINKFVIDAINIYDVLLTAIEHTNPSNTDKNLLDGIKMTVGEFEKMFEKIGVKRVEPKEGDMYDFNKHNAISSVANNLPNVTIIKTVITGYELFERLIKVAMVIVIYGNDK